MLKRSFRKGHDQAELSFDSSATLSTRLDVVVSQELHHMVRVEGLRKGKSRDVREVVEDAQFLVLFLWHLLYRLHISAVAPHAKLSLKLILMEHDLECNLAKKKRGNKEKI
jgi:hypothetical protein